MRGSPSASAAATATSTTRGPRSASSPMPRPFGFFVAMKLDCRPCRTAGRQAHSALCCRSPSRNTMATRVFVDGQEGTTGLRIHEYLARRGDVEILRAAPELRKEAAERARLLNAADVAFLCLPDAAAREAVALVSNPKTCLIDASTAHRTASDWVFGLPELAPDQRARIRASKRISNPGCHSTGFILLARPLVDAGLVSTTALLSATSITGYSGGGKKMIEQYEAGGDPRLDSPRPYGLKLNHKHLPEMAMHSRLESAPVFMPIVGRFLKGLSVAVPLHLATLKRGTTGAHLH